VDRTAAWPHWRRLRRQCVRRLRRRRHRQGASQGSVLRLHRARQGKARQGKARQCGNAAMRPGGHNGMLRCGQRTRLCAETRSKARRRYPRLLCSRAPSRRDPYSPSTKIPFVHCSLPSSSPRRSGRLQAQSSQLWPRAQGTNAPQPERLADGGVSRSDGMSSSAAEAAVAGRVSSGSGSDATAE
jgi:hypothetical protein